MVKAGRYIFAGAAWLFVIGVTAQVFLAGMVVVAAQMGWDPHVGLGHFLAAPVIFMLIGAYLGKLPRNMKWLTWALFGAYVLQADVLIFLRDAAPVAAAFHPVMALADFALGITLAVRALPLLRPVGNAPLMQPELP